MCKGEIKALERLRKQDRQSRSLIAAELDELKFNIEDLLELIPYDEVQIIDEEHREAVLQGLLECIGADIYVEVEPSNGFHVIEPEAELNDFDDDEEVALTDRFFPTPTAS